MTDCKHENITLDDYWAFYSEGVFRCPECGDHFYTNEIAELGYKLVKVESDEH